MTRSRALVVVALVGSLGSLGSLATACSDDDRFRGSYNGTLTISETSGPTVATAFTNLVPEENSAQIFDTTGPDTIRCNINGLGHSGDSVTFHCNELGCNCIVGPRSMTVTTAGGTLVDDHLTLAFSGTTGANEAFSAMFAGDLDPATR